MSVTRAEVVEAARSLIGMPWVHQGRNEHGIDCLGLVVTLCRRFDLSDYDITGYSRRPDTAAFLAHLRAGGGVPIPINAAVDGDVMAFRTARFPCHVGILSHRDGVPSIIHCPWRGRVREEPLAHDFPQRRVAAFVFPGVT